MRKLQMPLETKTLNLEGLSININNCRDIFALTSKTLSLLERQQFTLSEKGRKIRNIFIGLTLILMKIDMSISGELPFSYSFFPTKESQQYNSISYDHSLDDSSIPNRIEMKKIISTIKPEVGSIGLWDFIDLIHLFEEKSILAETCGRGEILLIWPQFCYSVLNNLFDELRHSFLSTRQRIFAEEKQVNEYAEAYLPLPIAVVTIVHEYAVNKKILSDFFNVHEEKSSKPPQKKESVSSTSSVVPH